MLVFDNMDAFSSAINFMKNNQDKDIDIFTNQFTNFMSYYSILESFGDDEYIEYEKYPNLLERVGEGDGTFSIEPTVKFNLIKHLLNKDAMVQIGQKAFKFTASHIYSIVVDEPIQSLVDGMYSDLSSLVSYPVTINEKYLGVNDREFESVCWKKVPWDSRRRVVGKVRKVEGWSFDELVLLTYHQKRYFGMRFKKKHKELVINGSGVYIEKHDGWQFPIPYSVNKIVHNVKQINFTVAYMGPRPTNNWGLDFLSNHSYHDCYGDVGCYIDFD